MELASGVDDADLISLFFDTNLQALGAVDDQGTIGQGVCASSPLSPDQSDGIVDVKVESSGNSESGDGSACHGDLVGCASSFDEHSGGWAPSPPSASGGDGPPTGVPFELSQQGCEQENAHLKRKFPAEIADDDESAEDKRKSRMMRNRESAQQSRQRKKLHMDELEQRVKELSEDNAKLTNENLALKQQLAFLCQRFGIHPVTGPFPPVGVVPGMVGTFPSMVPMPARLPLPGRRPTPLAASHKGRGRAKAGNSSTAKAQTAAAAVLSVFAFVFIALPFLGPSSPGSGNISLVPLHTQGVVPAMQGNPGLLSSPARRSLLSLDGSNASTLSYDYEETSQEQGSVQHALEQHSIGDVLSSVPVQPGWRQSENSSLQAIAEAAESDKPFLRRTSPAGTPWEGQHQADLIELPATLPVGPMGEPGNKGTLTREQLFSGKTVSSEGLVPSGSDRLVSAGSLGSRVIAGGLVRASDVWALDAMAALIRDDGQGLALLDLDIGQGRAVAGPAGHLRGASGSSLGDGGQSHQGIPRHSFAWAGGLLSSFQCREVLSIDKDDLSAAVAKKVTVSPASGAPLAPASSLGDDQAHRDGNAGHKDAHAAGGNHDLGHDVAGSDGRDVSRVDDGHGHTHGKQQRPTRKLGLLRRALMGSSAPQGPPVPLPPPVNHPRDNVAAAAGVAGQGVGGNNTHGVNGTHVDNDHGKVYYSNGAFVSGDGGARGARGFPFGPFDGRDDILKVSILVPSQGMNGEPIGGAGSTGVSGNTSGGGGIGEESRGGGPGMSQVLVVLLLNSAKYVTYACSLPTTAAPTIM